MSGVQGEVAFPQAPHPKAAACYDCYPPKFAIEQGPHSDQRLGCSCLALLCSKGVHTRMLSDITFKIFKCQCPENHPTQYFNQFQSSFKRALSPNLLKDHPKRITKGQAVLRVNDCGRLQEGFKQTWGANFSIFGIFRWSETRPQNDGPIGRFSGCDTM